MNTKIIVASAGGALLIAASIFSASAIGSSEQMSELSGEQVTAPTIELNDFTPSPEIHQPMQDSVPVPVTPDAPPVETAPEPPVTGDIATPSPASTPETEPSMTPTTDPFIEWLDNPTFTCDEGFAPGWLNEQGIPTGCVAN